MTDWTADVVIDLDDAATNAFLARHRVTTIVPLRCVVGARQREDLRRRLHEIYGTQMRIEATAGVVIERLRDIGVEVRVLKGLASAHLDYPHPELRQTSDVDLAIPPGTLDAAVQCLTRLGYLRPVAMPTSNHLLKGATMLAPGSGIEVDLHERLFQRSPTTDLLFDGQGEQLPNLNASAFGVELRLVHTAGHFILAPPGGRRMSGLLDVVVIRNRHSIDLSRALTIAQELRVARMVRSALRLEADLSGRDTADLHAWPDADWLERRTRLRPERNLALDHLSRFREVPRSRWLSYLPHWILPERRHRHLLKRRIDAHWRRIKMMCRRNDA